MSTRALESALLRSRGLVERHDFREALDVLKNAEPLVAMLTDNDVYLSFVFAINKGTAEFGIGDLDGASRTLEAVREVITEKRGYDTYFGIATAALARVRLGQDQLEEAECLARLAADKLSTPLNSFRARPLIVLGQIKILRCEYRVAVQLLDAAAWFASGDAEMTKIAACRAVASEYLSAEERRRREAVPARRRTKVLKGD